jgi:hypothetical protein
MPAYFEVDDYEVAVKCLHCNKKNAFNKPVYTIVDEHMAYMSVRCKACENDTHVGFSLHKGMVSLAFRAEEY